jgi:hypothetical protein
MKVACSLCEKEVDTTKEDVFMTVKWCFEELLKANEMEVNKDLGRVISVCSDCWTNKLEKKLSTEDYYWVYDKEV